MQITACTSCYCVFLSTVSGQAGGLKGGKDLTVSLFGDTSGSDSDSEGADLEEIYTSSSNECIITGVSNNPDLPGMLSPEDVAEGSVESCVLMSGDVTSQAQSLDQLHLQDDSTVGLSPDNCTDLVLTSGNGDALVQSLEQSHIQEKVYPLSDGSYTKVGTHDQDSFLSMKDCAEAGFESYVLVNSDSINKLDQTTGQVHILKTSASDPSSGLSHKPYVTESCAPGTFFNPLKKAINFVKQVLPQKNPLPPLQKQVLPQKPPLPPLKKPHVSQPPQPPHQNTVSQRERAPNAFEKAFNFAANAIKGVDNSKGTKTAGFALPGLPAMSFEQGVMKQDTKPVLHSAVSSAHPVWQGTKQAVTSAGPSAHSVHQETKPVPSYAVPSAHSELQNTKPVLTSAAHSVRQDTKPVLTSAAHPMWQDTKSVLTSAARPVRQDTKPVLSSEVSSVHPVLQDTKPSLSSAGSSAHPVRQDIKPAPSVNVRKRPLQQPRMPDSNKSTTLEQSGSHYVTVGSPESTSPKQKRAKLVQKKYKSMASSKKGDSGGGASKGVSPGKKAKSPGKKGKSGNSSPNKNKKARLVGKKSVAPLKDCAAVYGTLISSQSTVSVNSSTAVVSLPCQDDKFIPSIAALLNAELSSQRCVLAPIQNVAFSDCTRPPPSLPPDSNQQPQLVLSTAAAAQADPQHSGNMHESASIHSQELLDASSFTPLHSSSPAESSHKMQPSQSTNIPIGGTPALGEGLSLSLFLICFHFKMAQQL